MSITEHIIRNNMNSVLDLLPTIPVAELNAPNHDGHTLLYHALIANNVNAFEVILQRLDESVLRQPYHRCGRSLFYIAVMRNKYRIAQFIVDRYPETVVMTETDRANHTLRHWSEYNGYGPTYQPALYSFIEAHTCD